MAMDSSMIDDEEQEEQIHDDRADELYDCWHDGATDRELKVGYPYREPQEERP